MNCSRRVFLRAAGLATAGAAAGSMGKLLAESAKPTPKRPNVVFIIADDVSYFDIGCNGHPKIRTPNLDALAKTGLRCTNAWLTISSCSPSRCSIITGRYPHNTGAAELHLPLPKGQPLFPKELMKAGYYCAQAGKWHLGSYPKKAFHHAFMGKEKGPGGEGRWVKTLRERPKGKPFFMWFASNDAHRSWQRDPQAKPHTRADVVIPPYMVDDKPTRDDLRQYYDEIQRLDRYVGKVVAELKRQGVYENTCIIFMADNGRPFPRCKTRLYESGLKTPFIVHYPAGIAKPGSVSNSLISAIDIAPTILDMAGLKPSKAVQGVSFLPLLKNPAATVRNYAFGEHNWHDMGAFERMARWKNYLYIYNGLPNQATLPPGDCVQGGSFWSLVAAIENGTITPAQADSFIRYRPAEQLFDIKADPHQLANLAAKPEHKQTLVQMRKLLKTWQTQTGDSQLDDLSPDRPNRRINLGEKYQALPKKLPPAHTRRGRQPGSDKKADQINHPGPK